MKVPQPVTKTAWLASGGHARATKHVYVMTKPCVVPGPRGEAWEHLYKCSLTGEIRRWGIEDRIEIN